MKALDRDYFNEIDPIAYAVLKATQDGFIDERSIKEVMPDDVRGYTHCHWFAGAGLWAVAARMAGWPRTRPLWTASCPCQGESVAGKKLGADDPRHLWPDLFRLVRACRPPVLVGEQVDRAAGTHWLDRVWSDLESEDYSFRAVDIPACAVDAPQRRNRIYWVAVADHNKSFTRGHNASWTRQQPFHESNAQYVSFAVADADRGGCDGRTQNAVGLTVGRDVVERPVGSVGDADDQGGLQSKGGIGTIGGRGGDADARSYWDNSQWLRCADGKSRRAKRGIRLLVDGMVGRVDLWRLAGNSIVPQVAAEVLSALLETLDWSAAA